MVPDVRSRRRIRFDALDGFDADAALEFPSRDRVGVPVYHRIEIDANPEFDAYVVESGRNLSDVGVCDHIDGIDSVHDSNGAVGEAPGRAQWNAYGKRRHDWSGWSIHIPPSRVELDVRAQCPRVDQYTTGEHTDPRAVAIRADRPPNSPGRRTKRVPKTKSGWLRPSNGLRGADGANFDRSRPR